MESTTNGKNYTSSGQGDLNTVLGAIGTAAAFGIIGPNGINLGGNRPPADPPVSQRELDIRLQCERNLTEKDMRIGQLEAEKYSDKGDLETERRFDDKISALQKEINSLNQANAFLRERSDLLMRMTGVVINAPTILSSEAAASAFRVNGANAVQTTNNGGNANGGSGNG